MSQSPSTTSTATPGETPAITLASPATTENPLPQSKPASPNAIRSWCLLIFLICGSMLAVGFWLKPSSDGVGTHHQLGLAPCGMLRFSGIPCPTCGCTTAVSFVAHGNLIKAFITQPFGMVVGLVGIVLSILGLAGMITGKWYGPSTFLLNWYWRSIFVASVAILAAAWIYKIIAIKLGITA